MHAYHWAIKIYVLQQINKGYWPLLDISAEGNLGEEFEWSFLCNHSKKIEKYL